MDAKKFGAFIAAARKEKGMTQAELAAGLNVTDKAVSKWERGLGFPDINSLEPLADALGLSVLELMRSERLAAPALEPEVASAALSDAFALATLQRRAERKAIIKIVLNVTALILLIFLIDGIDFWVLSFVYMPVFAFLPAFLWLFMAFTAGGAVCPSFRPSPSPWQCCSFSSL